MRGTIVAPILGLALMLSAGTLVRGASEETAAPERTSDATGSVTSPILAGDGLYKQAWFLDSFLELADDLAQAQTQNKRFAILWEQKGCPYCERLHTANLARPGINRYVRENFTVLQLDLWGARQVTDFDGEVLTEKALARKWGVVFTPTIHFFVEEHELKAGEAGNRQLAATMPGYFRPFHFARMFEYVRGRHYEKLHFQKYIAKKAKEMREAGQAVDM
ncbi:MAG: Thioredoxin-related protein [Candidatus Kentron sp. G]|nr:MAG: Thioredoxin-related protein [Candidatus Kentron sp. G]